MSVSVAAMHAQAQPLKVYVCAVMRNEELFVVRDQQPVLFVCTDINVEPPTWSKGTIFMDGVPRDDEPSAPHRDSRSIVVTLITRITPEANAQPRKRVTHGQLRVTHGHPRAAICKSTFCTRRARHKAQPSAEDSGRCSGAAARWFVTPKRPGATCGAGEEYQEKYGPHGLLVRFWAFLGKGGSKTP